MKGSLQPSDQPGHHQAIAIQPANKQRSEDGKVDRGKRIHKRKRTRRARNKL